MILPNIQVTVRRVTETAVELATADGRLVTVDRALLPSIADGAVLNVAMDDKPLTGHEQRGKDILNEIIGPQGGS